MAKQNKVYDRSYSDKTGAVEISENGETHASFNVHAIAKAAGVTDEMLANGGLASILKASARYFGDIVTGTGNAARKADGGTPESAKAKMAETIKALADGTFTFRSASGQASLSLEDEQNVIAKTLVEMGKVADEATALKKVQALYGKTKTLANGNEVRPDYTALRNIPRIKDALQKAMPTNESETKLDDLLAEPKETAAEGQPA